MFAGGGGGQLERYIPQQRVVHFDLKGAPPKLSYLKNIFPLLKEAGATALLIEYEDMFPYWGPLGNVSARNCYSKQDIQTILGWASQNDLMAIPLIQTFGHLEFVLKLEEFKQLREASPFPQSLCPSQDEGWKLVTEMIDQGEGRTIVGVRNERLLVGLNSHLCLKIYSKTF